ncbi:MAG: DinB family protein [Vicinamibacteria bacterium]
MSAQVAPEIAILLGLLDEGFDLKAWHGPNLRGSLRGLSAAEAARRPARGRHNVWEVAVHAAYWKYAVRRRLAGEKRGSFRLQGSNWFARPAPGLRGAALERAWKADLALLADEHRLLREVVARLDVSELPKRSQGSRRTNLTLVRGVAAHDLYHAGQIQLLKRLVR